MILLYVIIGLCLAGLIGWYFWTPKPIFLPVTRNNTNRKKTVLIFDFDGTIADSLPNLIETIEDLATKFNYQQLGGNEIDILRRQGIYPTLKALGVPWWKRGLVLLTVQIRETQKIDTIKPICGITPVLTSLFEQGYMLGIVTNNTRHNVHRFIEDNNLHFFAFVKTGTELFGKQRLLKCCFNGNPPKQFVYFGDQNKDVIAAETVGMRCGGVTWGVNDGESFTPYNPTWVFEKPEDILKIDFDKV